MARDLQPLADLAATQAGLVTTDQAEKLGISRPQMSRWVTATRWRRVHQGVYLVHPDLYDDPLPFGLRLRAARLRHGADTIAVLQTAGTLHGLIGMPDADDIQLARRPGGERHQVPGIELHTLLLAHSEVTTVPTGGPVTTVLRTLADLVLTADRPHAVSMIDAALNSGLLTPDGLAELTASLDRRRGAVAARKRIAEADGRAESPLETRVRLTATDVGLPPDQLQLPVHSRSGHLLGYGDMAWRLPGGGWLVGECDGASVHDAPKALFRDRGRANAFWVDAGVPIIRFTWQDWDRRAYVRWLIRTGAQSAA